MRDFYKEQEDINNLMEFLKTNNFKLTEDFETNFQENIISFDHNLESYIEYDGFGTEISRKIFCVCHKGNNKLEFMLSTYYTKKEFRIDKLNDYEYRVILNPYLLSTVKDFITLFYL